MRVQRGGVISYSPRSLSVCMIKWQLVCPLNYGIISILAMCFLNTLISRTIFEHDQYTHAAPVLPLGGTFNARVLCEGRAGRFLSCSSSSASSEPMPNTRIPLGDT